MLTKLRKWGGGGGGGEYGYANPPICYDLLTKSALPFSPWIRNPGKNILITRKVQNQGPKNRWFRNPLQLQDPEIP